MGGLPLEHPDKIAPEIREELGRAAEISKRLRKERELASDGDVDFIPTEEYTTEDAVRADTDAAWVVTLAQRVIGGLSR